MNTSLLQQRTGCDRKFPYIHKAPRFLFMAFAPSLDHGPCLFSRDWGIHVHGADF